MKANVGGIDRKIRIALGVILLAWGVYAQNWWGLVGFVPLLTALIGWCPPYAIFGISTCSIKKE
jgi:hypothetical protein